MAKLKLELPVRVFDKQEVDKLKSLFSGIEVSWIFCQKETCFQTKIVATEKNNDSYRHALLGIKKLLEVFPDNEGLKDDLIKYENKIKNDKIYDVTITFKGEIAAEVDISENSILHYVGPIDTNLTNRDIEELKKQFEIEPFDDFYDSRIKKFVMCIILACVLAKPGQYLGCGGVDVWIDDQKYKTDIFLSSPLHNEAFMRHKDIMVTKLGYDKAFLWIKNYTKLQETNKKPPIPFTMLTYLFNRESHESLLYSVIGLENLYFSKNGGIAYTLQKRINYLFPSITKDQIKNIYSQRSDFVHGKVEMMMFKDYNDEINDILQFDDAAILACALLLETLRMLAVNNASKISFNEQLSHKFIYQ